MIVKSEFLTLLIRASGVITSACASIIALKALLLLTKSEGAVLIAILSWVVFIPLGQLGYGRPVYGCIRRGFEKGNSNENLIEYFLSINRRLAIQVSLTFCIFSFAYAQFHIPVVNAIIVSVFALGLASLNSGIYQRDIAYALSRESKYESIELFRKLIMLFGFLAIESGLSIWGFGLLTLLAGTLTQKRLAQILNPLGVSDKLTREFKLKRKIDLRVDARRYFFFTTNELLLYNLPLVVFSFVGSLQEIVLTSIWMRLFQLLVLPMRLIVDARMNRLMSSYFQGYLQEVRQGLILNVLGSAALTGFILVFLAYFKFSFFGWLGAAALVDEPYLIPSLAIWAIFNSVQHSFGSFILSYGGGFNFASEMSLFALISTAFTFGVMLILDFSFGQILLGTGLIYGLFAFKYGFNAFRLLRNPLV
jgi:hypothetical protein